MRSRILLMAAQGCAALLLVSCGGDPAPDPSGPETTEPRSTTTSEAAEPTTEEGPQERTGSFRPLPTGPATAPDVTGTALLATGDLGTSVTLDLAGLVPGDSYASHLHAGECADGGGPHFKFDPAGPGQPPNEVHLAFVADEAGDAAPTVTNPDPASGDARSVVLHDDRGRAFACADLED